ncbi:hypothetical protein MKZ38_001981 [Zalerion maritima]|uniref:Signal recognition particle subunit SRP72 n=1 Tax=Zalerion maritima TaxID=339359 RepID=A0AAD5RQJ4_9PEZI|nr:hypothetical protein MKZ38_001981 [Zalerion maritima]
MAPDPTTRLAQLLGASTIDDDQEVYNVATAAIGANKSDLDAHRTRIVALLKLDRFSDALRLLNSVNDKVQDYCVLEKAYALYKTNEFDKALSLIGPLPETPDQDYGSSLRAFRHLSAQVAYKSENFLKAGEQYGFLAKDQRSDEDVDLAVNALATYAQMQWRIGGCPPSIESLADQVPDSFEAVFNQGCFALAQGHLDDAVEVIGRSAAMCLASDLSDDDKRVEMIPILIQQTYALTRLEKFEEAAETLKSIDTKDTDASTAHFRQINTLAVQQLLQGNSKSSNPFLAQSSIDLLPPIPLEDKVFDYQAWRMECDKHIINLQAFKYEGVARSITKNLQQPVLPSSSVRINALSAVRAAAEVKLQTGKPAIRKLTTIFESRPSDIGLLLTLVQLYITVGNYHMAVALLEDFGKHIDESEDKEAAGSRCRYLAGLVAVRVTLLKKQNRHTAARDELARAVSFWIEHGNENDEEQVATKSILREAGIELIHSTDANHLSAAGAAFEHLAKSGGGGGSDKVAEAGFVASVATTDYSQVEPYIPSLEDVDDLADDVDVNALLEGGVVAFPSQIEKQRKKRAAADSLEPAKRSKKRKMRKLPKNYVEGKEVDPERWLPMKDRSYYKPRGRKGKKKAMEATQGGAVKGDTGEVLELVGGAGAVKVEKASGGGGGGGGKKKKKGKK